MSHSRERKEKICLNCNAELHGRYCHLCGQENVEPKESAWAVIKHFFYDITHFDSKFFNTVKYLIGRPGLLPKEYMIGRRASYLNPIKMYVFTSAVFFIIFFSLFTADRLGLKKADFGKAVNSLNISLAAAKKIALDSARTREDSIDVERTFERVGVPAASKVKFNNPKNKNITVSLMNSPYKTRREYDSVQKILPLSKKDGWFKRKVHYRSIELNNRVKEDLGALLQDGIDQFIHLFPYLLFVSLPLYALFLKLLYIRRKQFYYVNHGIFLIHLYIFTFLWLLVFIGLFELNKTINSGGIGWIAFLQAALVVYGIYYAFRAMHKFYGQGVGKTFVKFILLNILAFMSLLMLFILFFILTVFKV